jgi:hypothetical protein
MEMGVKPYVVKIGVDILSIQETDLLIRKELTISHVASPVCAPRY